MKSLILNRLAVIGLGLAALTSCTNLNENSEWGNGSKVKFSSYIAGQRQCVQAERLGLTAIKSASL